MAPLQLPWFKPLQRPAGARQRAIRDEALRLILESGDRRRIAALLEDLCADPAPFREQQLGGGRWQLFFEGPGETPPALFHLASSWPKHPP